MKNELKLVLLFVSLSLFFTSCDKSDDNQTPESIGLEIQDENVFTGKKDIEGHIISYKVESKEELTFNVEVTIDKNTLSASVAYGDETIDFDGNDVVLTHKQKEILLMLGEEISLFLFKDKSADNFTMAEYTLLRLLEYWAKSPSNYKYSKVKVKSPKNVMTDLKSRNEGVTCIRKNTVVTANYDDDRGDVNENILVNGDRCIGRCGSGCPGTFTIASAWTKDCLDHDRCGRVNGGSTNPFDRECGDEYFEAADDYLFGVIRGCRG
ncbi:hypothetical protein [Aquimarina algiphila]|uniref:hypothetical protein n=1 Tax=Aquimarina algiphila TaxID=2047982 RepID=UPI0023300ADE|nr:hypothetical protein [Aquimarina algiphila]